MASERFYLRWTKFHFLTTFWLVLITCIALQFHYVQVWISWYLLTITTTISLFLEQHNDDSQMLRIHVWKSYNTRCNFNLLRVIYTTNYRISLKWLKRWYPSIPVTGCWKQNSPGQVSSPQTHSMDNFMYTSLLAVAVQIC